MSLCVSELVSSQMGVDPGSIAGGVASVIIVLGVIIVFSIIYKRYFKIYQDDVDKIA